jgi:phospholipid transport system substrate-binding protein
VTIRETSGRASENQQMSFQSRLSRRSILIAGIAAQMLLPVSRALAATPAEAWVADNVQRGLTILNKKQPAAKRRDEFEVFLLSLIDFRAIALYTLGAGKRTATPEQQDQFVEAFKHYAEAVYESYLLRYSGQTLKVTGSSPGRPGESVVRTVLIDPNNPGNSDPYKVDFRVGETNGKFLVKDASVEGVWLAILEHEDFDAFLSQNNNNVAALTAHLQKLTKDLQKG